MKTALHFPHIRVPQNSWFSQVLLHCDQAASIVPRTARDDPNVMDPYTAELVTKKLLTYVEPDDQLRPVMDDFINGFLELIEPGPPPATRRPLSGAGDVSPGRPSGRTPGTPQERSGPARPTRPRCASASSARRLTTTRPVACAMSTGAFGRSKASSTRGSAVETNEQLCAFVAKEAWGHHASCTAPIGPSGDRPAVVDSELRVLHGVHQLRVVDDSHFPRIPGFFIVIPTYIVSEEASDLLIASARDRRIDLDSSTSTTYREQV